MISIASLASISISILLLAEFLRNFARGVTPFGTAQYCRLLIAAALLVAKTVLDSIVPPFGPVSVDGIPSTITFDSGAGLDLKVVVMVVFLVCLAMVVRYGDALKEDSDAFV